MTLAWLIAIPIIAGLLAWLTARWNHVLARWLALGACLLDLVLAATYWNRGPLLDLPGRSWLEQLNWPWIPQLGVSFHLALDGLSLLLVLLTAFVGMLSVAASWRGIRRRVGFFHLNLMLILAGIMGVFLAMDLFLFYFFWELMLVPMYFLIDIWGHENRHRAAVKFFIFTQLSGLLMLLAILGLYFAHGQATGRHTFDYFELLGTPLSPAEGLWLMLGFFVAFAVKLPAVPFHTWLPDAHTEAPTAGSVILAGLLLKTGAYGLIRFVVPLFPQAAFQLAPLAMTLGVVGIIYGAVLAFAQTDLKRLVAYSSVSHLGFVLLGVFSLDALALKGAVMQMICHALSTGGLFVVAGIIGDRLGTRDLARLGGLWAVAPRLGASAMFLAMASLGLPGLGNFVGEFLILLGAWRANPALTAVAAVGLVASTIYALWLIQRAFHGPKREDLTLRDLSRGELAILVLMIAGLLWLGLFPSPILGRIGSTGVPPVSSYITGEMPVLPTATGGTPVLPTATGGTPVLPTATGGTPVLPRRGGPP